MNIIHICFLFVGLSFSLAFAGLSVSLFSRFSMRFFLLYLLLEALNFGLDWLLVHPGSSYKAAWMALMMASSFLLAPCVWLFACEINQNAVPNIWPPAWGQCAVVALGFLLVVPLMLAAHGGQLLVDPSVPPTPLSDYIHTTMVAAVLLYLVQVPWYLLRCLRLFRERERLDRFLFSSIDEPGLNTLRILMWVMAANWVLGLARTLRGMLFQWSHAWGLFVSVCEVGVALVALYAIFKRFWQYNLDDQRMLESLAPGALLAPDVQKAESEPQTKKYAKSSLDNKTRDRVLTKIVAQFEQQKIYRNSDLKLQHLCDAIRESSHYVSQVINQDLGFNFYDLVNHHRIEEAKVRLRQDSKVPIMEIAYEVGFNSKSTFNKAFKSATGKTPGAYRSAGV